MQIAMDSPKKDKPKSDLADAGVTLQSNATLFPLNITSITQAMDLYETTLIKRALHLCHNNRRQTSIMLNMVERTFCNR